MTRRRDDTKLLRLVDELHASCDREDWGADKIEAIDKEIDQVRAKLRKRLGKAEAKQERRTEKGSRLFDKIMATRAKSIDGMLAKVRARKRWNTDEWQIEKNILESLIADIKSIAKD